MKYLTLIALVSLAAACAAPETQSTESTTTTSTTEPTGTVDDAAAPPPPPSDTCNAAKDCADGFVCEVTTCRGDGRCVAATTFGAQPVCGCDKLTYAVVQLAKGTVRHAGECLKDEATPCTVNGNGCSGGAKCNAPLGDLIQCVGNPAGTCWKLQDCPAAPRSFRTCGAGGGVSCTSACEAVASGKAYYKALSCP